MRVCHPGPVAFHPAITSGGRRSESSCLGFAVGGRPRRTSFVPRRNSAPTIHSFVISGASSLGEELTERFRFALMAVPNDSPGRAAWRPNEYNQSCIEPADSSASGLAVIKAIVDTGEVIPDEDPFGSAHIEPPFLQRALTLRGIAGDAHTLL
jgi:hypothetical protein